MEPVSQKLYELESDTDRAREDAARPGAPYRIAAQKLTRLAGRRLTDAQLERASLVLHYGLAISWAPLHALLRRGTALSPITAGLATGAAMSVFADELMTPAFGFSAPNGHRDRVGPTRPPALTSADRHEFDPHEGEA